MALLLMTAASLNVRGQLVDSFSTNINDNVNAIKVQADGRILIGGNFTRVNGETRNRIARLNPDGTLDTTFGNADVNGQITTIAIQADGKILIGGQFQTVGGQTRISMARLNANGTLDTEFNVNLTSPFNFIYVYALAVQPDGRILIGGVFSGVGGQTRNHLARVNADGSLDASFNPNPDSYIESITLQPNGKILVGGRFSAFGGSTRHRIARLNADGTLDATFNSPFTTPTNHRGVVSIAVQADGKIIIGDYTTTVNSVKPVTRLNADGTLDEAFNQNIENIDNVLSVALQPDGKILVGMFLTNTFKLVRLNTDGKRDPGFIPYPNSSVHTINVQPDGKILVGGSFNEIGGVTRSGIARLRSDFSVLRPTKFDFNGDGIADQAVFRPSDKIWYVLRSNQGLLAYWFAAPMDKFAPADYDGDWRTDIGVFRDGIWNWRNSTNGSESFYQFGIAGDIPVPADYTGDGRSELAVYRSGNWHTLNLANNQSQTVHFGVASDKPVPADYDGDGKTDFAVYRDGNWYWQRSSDNGFSAVHWGIASDKPVVGDYDGDLKADPAVFRNGVWYVLASTQGFFAVQFGISSDIPVAADYDGDGKTDVAVFRDGNWYWLNSSNNQFRAVQWGLASDKPIPAAFVP
ncbi:MAG TPA: hypothetical protein VF648_02330 [Pyrinomonadaceae bacterium]